MITKSTALRHRQLWVRVPVPSVPVTAHVSLSEVFLASKENKDILAV